MGVISIVNGDYKPTYNYGGTTLYPTTPSCFEGGSVPRVSMYGRCQPHGVEVPDLWGPNGGCRRLPNMFLQILFGEVK